MPKPKTRIILPYNMTCGIKAVCPSAEYLGVNHLHDYALLYRDHTLTAEPRKGHIIDTPVYSISANEEKCVDKVFSLYSDKMKKSEVTIQVSVEGKIVKRRALLYTVDPSEPMSLPEPLYLRLLAETLAHIGIEFLPIFDAYTETRQLIDSKAGA
jgi:hypothetical protein